MSICFNENLIVNSEDQLCCIFTTMNSNAYINVSNCSLGYDADTNFFNISDKLLLGINSNYHNTNIITTNSIKGWNNLYTSNIITNNITFNNNNIIYLELELLRDYNNNVNIVPFQSTNSYWNNQTFKLTIPVSGIYGINYSWCSDQSLVISKIKINENYFLECNLPNASNQLIKLLNKNDILSFYFNGNLKSSFDNYVSKACISLISRI